MKSDVVKHLLDRCIPSGDCLLWQKSIRNGYGQLTLHGKVHYAHRLMYEAYYNHSIPKDQLVRHLCGNPACCNPQHLALGTQKDNMQDMVQHGRSRPGVKHHNVKLSEVEVELIRNSTATQRVLAKQFGVCQTTISLIKRGKRWV